MDLDGLSNATNAGKKHTFPLSSSRVVAMEPLHRLPAATHEDVHPHQLPQFPHVRRTRVPKEALQAKTEETDLIPRAPPEHEQQLLEEAGALRDLEPLDQVVGVFARLPHLQGTQMQKAGQMQETDSRKYQYTYHNNQYITRESKTRADKCGVTFSKPQMLRIIGGTEAEKFKWPWHVAILNQFNEVFCGGTLIASRWVLTASHCIRKQLRVRLNAHDLRSRHGDDIEMGVYKMFAHPRFEMKTVDNDIALLMLPRQVRVPVACLPNKKPKAGQICSVMGWGKVQTTDLYGVPVLHEAK
ncbi:hypothetical protein D910_00087, partial [Dendroctonus ponderosae]